MKIAVVTGAGRGLGREIAKGLANKGFTVLATDINAESAADAAREIGRGAWSMAHDARDPEAHRRVAEAASERGSLRLWVNNAGVLYTGDAWEHDDEIIRQIFEVNTLGMIYGSRTAVDAMRHEGGHLINIASLSAVAPVPGLAVYGASKQAVLGFTISLAGDLDRAGIPVEVSAVCPHAINTDMVRSVQDLKGADIAFVGARLLTVNEVADVVLDLVDKPRLAVSVPRSQGALAHALRPFPSVALRVLRPLLRVGEWQRRRASGER